MGHKVTYSPEIRLTEEGRRWYQQWLKIREKPHSIEFDTYPGFYEWAKTQDYAIGDRLTRWDDGEPYSPENCYFAIPASQKSFSNEEYQCWIQKWNEAVDVIRKFYGMPPLKEEKK